MRLSEVRETVSAIPAWDCRRDDRGVSSCHASDLISDLLACYGMDALLLTGLTNAQVIRTAEILEFAAICFVRGKAPQPDTLQLAQDTGIPLYVTRLSMYECCGLLYSAGLAVGARTEAVAGCPT